MSVFRALADGVGRTRRAPAILMGVWLMTLALSAPLALSVGDAVGRHLGASLEAEAAASGVNYDWMQEFAQQASGLSATLGPNVIGAGAVVDNLSAFVDRDPRPVAITAAAVAYLGLWIFVSGGILDRYARDRAIRPLGFFAASGVFFFRFLRLGLVAFLLYSLLLGALHPFLFGDVYPSLTRDLTAERSAFLVRASLYVVFLAPLALVNLIFDYAKIRAVVEDRRSMAMTLVAAVRFLRSNGAAAVALYLLDALLLGLVLATYALAAPGAASTWLAFGVGQLYVLGRLWVKLVFWASATALFQGRLAHAGYAARRLPAWPDSPAAEAAGA
jgi:hypothetical protein